MIWSIAVAVVLVTLKEQKISKLEITDWLQIR